jgi:hypothetical protein
MDFTTGLTITVSVVLAVVGYIATYVYGLRLAQRKDRLDRVNRQLSEFYGPLLALVSASQSSWEAFRGRYRPVPRSFWSDDPPPTAEDQAIWRLWVTEVFMPLNLEMVDVVTHHADLLDERQMPPGLLTLCAHVASYKPVVKQWETGDFSECGAAAVRVRRVFEDQDAAVRSTGSTQTSCSLVRYMAEARPRAHAAGQLGDWWPARPSCSLSCLGLNFARSPPRRRHLRRADKNRRARYTVTTNRVPCRESASPRAREGLPESTAAR